MTDAHRSTDRADPRRIATKSDFGRELSLAKQEAGVSIRDIAKAAGAPPSTVGGYLSGRHLPAMRPADQLGRVLAVCGIADEAAVELWRQALRRARHAVTHHSAPTPPPPPSAPPPSPTPSLPAAYQPAPYMPAPFAPPPFVPSPLVPSPLVPGPLAPGPFVPASADAWTMAAGKPVLVSTRPPLDRLAQGPTLRGRDDLLARLSRRLDHLASARAPGGGCSGRDVVVLHGLGGSGKSTLALTLAKMAADRDIQTWWVSGADCDSLVAGMQALSSELGADPDQIRMGSPPDVAWRLLAAHQQPWLLVIDNADDPPASLALPGSAVTDGNGWLRSIDSGLGLIVVTTRDGGVGAWGESPPRWLDTVAVRPLGTDDGRMLLQELAGQRAGTDEEARDLAARLGGLPLALCLAGRHIAEAASIPPAFAGADAARSFAGYHRALDQGRHPEVLGGAATEPNPGDLVGRTWEMSLDMLASRGLAQARPLLRLLSCLGPAPVACGLLLHPAVISRSPLFGPISGRLLWETLLALAGLGILDLTRDQNADPDLADVVVPHQLVRDTSRRSADVQADVGGYLALVTELVAEAAAGLDPKDPRTWGRWRALVDHASSPLDLVLQFRLSPKAIPAGLLTAATLSARFLRSAGELVQAEAAFARLARLGVLALGEEDPRVLEIQNDLGRCWYNLGRLNTAVRGLRAVASARERVLGPEHPDTLTTQHYLARALRDSGELDTAWRLFRHTLDTRRAVLGDEHPDTLTSRNNVADALRELGHHDRAALELQAVFRSRCRVLGEEHPATLVTRYHLARLAHERDDLDGAEHQIKELLEVYERVLGPDHPRTLLTRQALADVWHDRGRLRPALGEAEQVLARRRALLGEDHPATLATRHRLGLLHLDLGNLAVAEAELADVLAARRRVLGRHHPDTGLVCASLSALRSRSGPHPVDHDVRHRDTPSIPALSS